MDEYEEEEEEEKTQAENLRELHTAIATSNSPGKEKNRNAGEE